jgi:hypothetical protein
MAIVGTYTEQLEKFELFPKNAIFQRRRTTLCQRRLSEILKAAAVFSVIVFFLYFFV